MRRAAHRLGFRFRLHRRDLPGVPDLVFPRFRRVLFVHGCFWHSHAGCSEAHVPKSAVNYWRPKLERNVLRDRDNETKLTTENWRVLTLWECELADRYSLIRRLTAFLKE